MLHLDIVFLRKRSYLYFFFSFQKRSEGVACYIFTLHFLTEGKPSKEHVVPLWNQTHLKFHIPNFSSSQFSHPAVSHHKFTDLVDSCQRWVSLWVKHCSEKEIRKSTLSCSNIHCFLASPTRQPPLFSLANFWAVPAAFVTTQVKVDLRSSDMTFFNSRLLWRIAPSANVDLKQTDKHYRSAAGCYFVLLTNSILKSGGKKKSLYLQLGLVTALNNNNNNNNTHSSDSTILPLLGVSSGKEPLTSQ